MEEVSSSPAPQAGPQDWDPEGPGILLDRDLGAIGAPGGGKDKAPSPQAPRGLRGALRGPRVLFLAPPPRGLWGSPVPRGPRGALLMRRGPMDARAPRGAQDPRVLGAPRGPPARRSLTQRSRAQTLAQGSLEPPGGFGNWGWVLGTLGPSGPPEDPQGGWAPGAPRPGIPGPGAPSAPAVRPNTQDGVSGGLRGSCGEPKGPRGPPGPGPADRSRIPPSPTFP